MRIETVRRRPAAVFPFAFLALLSVGAVPAAAATGERHIQPPRERLLLPLGAGGAADPIATATRKVERDLAAAGKTLTRAHLMASPGARQGPLAADRPLAGDGLSGPGNGPAASPARPRLLPITEFSPGWGPVSVGNASDEPRIVLAAIDRTAVSTNGILSDVPRLPWADVPMLPPLLSAVREGPRAAPVVTLSEPRPARRERNLVHAPVPAPLQFLAPHRSQSLRIMATASVSQAPRVPLSLPGASIPALDPLADPKRDAPPASKPALAGPQFILPFEYGHVSSLFNQGRRHPAIDLAGKMGAPVFSTSNGQKVTFAGARGGYGNAVITRDAEGREHLYGHLSAIQTRVGITLSQGERLGLLGSTGFSTGPHVHYEVKDKRGAHINPVSLLFPNGVSAGYRWAAVAIPAGPAAQAALR